MPPASDWGAPTVAAGARVTVLLIGDTAHGAGAPNDLLPSHLRPALPPPPPPSAPAASGSPSAALAGTAGGSGGAEAPPEPIGVLTTGEGGDALTAAVRSALASGLAAASWRAELRALPGAPSADATADALPARTQTRPHAGSACTHASPHVHHHPALGRTLLWRANPSRAPISACARLTAPALRVRVPPRSIVLALGVSVGSLDALGTAGMPLRHVGPFSSILRQVRTPTLSPNPQPFTPGPHTHPAPKPNTAAAPRRPAPSSLVRQACAERAPSTLVGDWGAAQLGGSLILCMPAESPIAHAALLPLLPLLPHAVVQARGSCNLKAVA
eukprot:6995935-Prymnesium_polylepis.2